MKATLAILFAFMTAGCELYQPPQVTPALAPAAKRQHADLTTLQRGRQLFANRCIQCHTLPSVWYYSREDWPGIVHSMAHRAALRPDERNAIVAYILAVRAER